MMRRNFFSKICLGLFLILIIVGQAFTAVAQFDSDETYEVIVEVPVVRNNFVSARKKAIKIALRTALEQDLREILDNDEFERNRPEIQKILRAPKDYVKSYRFLESYDDPDQLVSYVNLEVIFFQNAINKSLKRRGVILGLDSVKQVVILINESNLNSEKETSFLETVPIAEALLSKSFVEAGISVVNRDLIRYEVSEKTIMSAIQGSISAAASIGSTVGVDIVILGNATSTTVINKKKINLKIVQVGINVKAISSSQSKVVAAKSDFSTVTRDEIFESETVASYRAGKKITEFLIPAIQKYWEPESAKKKAKQGLAIDVDSTPIPFGDL
jgi:hypothetical protein|tara:strand:+ start:1276 stop:2265 length:990 start_codon:yes stop_codon:yes gene_type:complete